MRSGARGIKLRKGIVVSEVSDAIGRVGVRGWLKDTLASKGKIDQLDQQAVVRAICPGLPAECLSRVGVSVSDGWDSCQTPWNRRLRRSIIKAKPGQLLLRFFAEGPRLRGPGRVVEVGRKFGSDLLLGSVFQQVLDWAARGVIGGVVGHLDRESFFKGPGKADFGLPWDASCLEGEEGQVLGDNVVIWFRFLLVTLVAQAALDLGGSGSGNVESDEGEF